MEKKMSKKKDKTKDELQKELDTEKRSTWKNFQKLDYDKMTDEQRKEWAGKLYETMSQRLSVEATALPFDFWKDYKNEEFEIKEIKKFIERVDNVLDHIPTNPSKDAWLDKSRGIIPTLRKEWKEKLEPFKHERNLRKLLNDKAAELFNLPENKNKEIVVDIGESVKKAQEYIDNEISKPVREKITKIEEGIKKKVS